MAYGIETIYNAGGRGVDATCLTLHVFASGTHQMTGAVLAANTITVAGLTPDPSKFIVQVRQIGTKARSNNALGNHLQIMYENAINTNAGSAWPPIYVKLGTGSFDLYSSGTSYWPKVTWMIWKLGA